ncbi:MAG: Flp pilus assembly complex ATPase component TadA [Planctomycetes bacterium]|nr:Flp pilus assembly complex ATPase component TadA [Planctomycetota bacterium]
MGLVTPEKIEDALVHARRTGSRLGEALVDLNMLSEEQITRALCRQNKLPFVDLSKVTLPKEVIGLMDGKVVEEYDVVPIKKQGRQVLCAIRDPGQVFQADGLQFVLNAEIKFALTTPADLTNAKAQYYGIGSKVERRGPAASAAAKDIEDDDAPIIRLVHQVLEEALRARASDIHVEPMAERVRVRYRVDGICFESKNLPKDIQGPIISRIKIMAKMDIAEKRKPQDGRIQVDLMGRSIDLRVSALPATHGESMVMRILDREVALVNLQQLGFSAEDYARFQRIIKKPNGIFLVTGPTGSGKTTSLYAALQELNQPNVKIITAENPIEYHLKGINQCEVRHGIGLDFARILRGMLRQAPNIILVGEIRDLETAEIAIQAALTGHLVFSTLHTNDAPSALTRLIDLGVKPFLVSTAVLAVMAQRLFRVLCSSCKAPWEPEPAKLRALQLEPAHIEGKTLYKAVGCKECRHEGYRGRKGIFEMFEMDARMRDLTFKGASTLEIRTQARASCGMLTLREDGVRKILAGITSVDEVMRVAGSALEV